MRCEAEILDVVLKTAAEDDSVRAVIRTDLKPVRDFLYTYNFCYIVNDIGKFDDNDIFGKCFGERILLFRGDKNYPEMFPCTKAHLMVFRDGVTIVIHAMDREAFLSRFNREREQENVWIGDTYQKLLDKDDMLPEIERLEEAQTLFAEAPTEEEFLGACREFWWVMKTFAEYTLREELLSAMYYLNVAVRDLLNRMLRWHIFLREGKPVDTGILDSNMDKLLEKELFGIYKKTYPDADYRHISEAFDAAAGLWSKVGGMVAERCGYVYPADIEKDMLEYFARLRKQKESGNVMK